MILVEEWIAESREVRSAHLDISEPCLERGGNSTVHRGVLAQYLGTNMPSNVDLCHNCGNGKCSNPKHLYWGTRKENIEDAKRHGTWKSGWERMVEKHGEAGARKIRSEVCDTAKAGAGNKGNPKKKEHKEKIAKTIKTMYDSGELLGRKVNTQVIQ
jgi:hypothetical protein